MYVNVCMVITYSRAWINQVRLPILLVVSWTGKMNIPLSPFAPENLVSRDGYSRLVPRQPAHSPYSSWIWCLLTGFLPISAAASIYCFNRHTPSGLSRVHQVTQLRTDGVRYRESAGTGPIVLKVVPVTDAAFAVHQGPINQWCASLFPHPLLVWSEHIECTGVISLHKSPSLNNGTCTDFLVECIVVKFSRLGISRVGLSILLVVSWKGENISCPRSPLIIWSRETGSAVPFRVSPLILCTQA